MDKDTAIGQIAKIKEQCKELELKDIAVLFEEKKQGQPEKQEEPEKRNFLGKVKKK